VGLAGVLGGIVTSVTTLVYTDQARKRERKADKEEKDRTERRAKADRETEERLRKTELETKAQEEYRLNLLNSLLPAISFLEEYPPNVEASDETINEFIDRLQSESMKRAVEALVLVGLVYPSPRAQALAGGVRASVQNVVLVEEMALKAASQEDRKAKLTVAQETMRRASESIRDLAKEIRGPLPWETKPLP
jgi:hypothetical protein